jgi:hypothetical protein
MSCEINFANLEDIAYSCNLDFTGGLKTIKLMEKAEWQVAIDGDGTNAAEVEINGTSGEYDFVSGTTDLTLIAGTDVITLGFNNKDGFSNFADVKTVNADGSSSAVPTVQVEFARMSSSLRNDLDKIATGGGEMVAVVETAAGTVHAIGTEFGLYAASVDGATGAARTDKNRYQLTLTGEENSLAYGVSSALWTAIKAL